MVGSGRWSASENDVGHHLKWPKNMVRGPIVGCSYTWHLWSYQGLVWYLEFRNWVWIQFLPLYRVESLVRVVSLPCQRQKVVWLARGCVHLIRLSSSSFICDICHPSVVNHPHPTSCAIRQLPLYLPLGSKYVWQLVDYQVCFWWQQINVNPNYLNAKASPRALECGRERRHLCGSILL